jgi:antitoxin (DNA-binding transcriptional repressor) of toxin-antitoxin stability system
MYITISELRENLATYIAKSSQEDIFITKNGKVVSKLSNPYESRIKVAESLIGVIPDDISYDEVMEERLSKL